MSGWDNLIVGSRRHSLLMGLTEASLEKVNVARGHHGIEPLDASLWTARNSGATAIRYIPSVRVIQPSSNSNGHGGRSCCGGAPAKRKSLVGNLLTKAGNVVRAGVDFWQDGMEIATEPQQDHRLTVCGGCPLNEDGWCDPSLTKGGCGCNLKLKVKARAAACPQGRWFDYGDDYRPLVNPTRNLLFHVFPKIGAEWNWHWHLDKIRKHAAIFNGKIVIGIVTGSGLASPDEVKRLLGGVPVNDWIIRPNVTTLGETVTFRDMLECVKTDDPNAVTFRFHTKGASHPQTGFRKAWAELIWTVCMDLPSVDDALASHHFAMAMKSHEPLVRGKKYDWFGAGSGYWFRNREAFAADWSHTETLRWWAEAWPNHVCKNKDAASLCHDHTAGASFSEAYFKTNVMADFANWKAARLPRGTEPAIAATPLTGIVLLTPTGDRPDAFALCEKWMARQTFKGPVHWIVVDDGSIATRCTMGQEYIRRHPARGEGHTLTQNLRLALPRIRGDKILIIEDDEWYAPNYVEQMVKWLDESPLVGAGFARYYWPRDARYLEHSEHTHASLCRTGFRSELLPAFAAAIAPNDPSVDMRLWKSSHGVRHDDDQPLVIGMKGMPGRPSGGGKPTNGHDDDSLTVLRSWIGDDVEHYRPVLPKLVDAKRAKREKIVVYTVVLGGHDVIRPPLVINPGVRYVAITDGKAPPPWEMMRVPAMGRDNAKHSRYCKLLAHEMFPDADWTLYVDGQLQLAVDPLALLAECEAWGTSPLYLFHHQDRDCIFDEIPAIARVGRDKASNMASQEARYRQAGFPRHAGLYLGGILIRRAGGACDAFNAAWWGEVSGGSHRDQISLPVALKSSGVQFTALPANWWNHLFLRHPHAKRR